MMNQFAVIGMVVAMLGVVAVLATGLITMVSGKDVTGEKSNKMMWWRIYLQAAALAFFALIFALSK
jgi:hypothetical protein